MVEIKMDSESDSAVNPNISSIKEEIKNLNEKKSEKENETIEIKQERNACQVLLTYFLCKEIK